jgi:hypothetical protein
MARDAPSTLEGRADGPPLHQRGGLAWSGGEVSIGLAGCSGASFCVIDSTIGGTSVSSLWDACAGRLALSGEGDWVDVGCERWTVVMVRVPTSLPEFDGSRGMGCGPVS